MFHDLERDLGELEEEPLTSLAARVRGGIERVNEVNRKMLELELSAKRVTECGVERIERFENIIELFD